jgi:MoxR-like ATPase
MPSVGLSELTGDRLSGEAAPFDVAAAKEFQTSVGRIADAVNGFLQGKPEVVSLALTCLLAEGHLLLEDVPGVGKTSLAHSLASALGAPWQRIQFTPDLLPGDVTGVSVFHQDSSTFVFHPGPVFSNVVLADEINRAAPRTQSALLEVMEERQVTVDGRPHPVPRPFLVIATQNPVEMDGTYPLPEAQLDRFLLKLTMPLPSRTDEVSVLTRHSEGFDPRDLGAAGVRPVAGAEVRVLAAEHAGASVGQVPQVSDPEEVSALVNAARRVHVAPAIFDYIASLVEHTRKMEQLRLGSSPRGGLGLLRASRVRAALNGRPFVVPSDVQALAEPVLGHRMLVAPAYEASGGTASHAAIEAVSAVPVPPGDGQR